MAPTTVTIEVPRRFALGMLRRVLSEGEMSLEEEAHFARQLDEVARAAVG